MKYKILLNSAFICFSAYSHAGCVGPEVNGKCLSGTSVYGYNSGSNSDSEYKSNSGARYQYNLSNPGDSTQYLIDLDAQRRDQINTDSRRDLDRRSGQYGGGINN